MKFSLLNLTRLANLVINAVALPIAMVYIAPFSKNYSGTVVIALYTILVLWAFFYIGLYQYCFTLQNSSFSTLVSLGFLVVYTVLNPGLLFHNGYLYFLATLIALVFIYIFILLKMRTEISLTKQPALYWFIALVFLGFQLYYIFFSSLALQEVWRSSQTLQRGLPLIAIVLSSAISSCVTLYKILNSGAVMSAASSLAHPHEEAWTSWNGVTLFAMITSVLSAFAFLILLGQ